MEYKKCETLNIKDEVGEIYVYLRLGAYYHMGVPHFSVTLLMCLYPGRGDLKILF